MADTKRLVVEQVSTILFRGAIYQALALGFGYPSEATLSQLKGQWGRLLEASLHWPDGVKPRFVQAARLLHGSDGETLQTEYIRLFGPAGSCPLHETTYGDAGGLLGKAAQLADISGFYLAFGVQPGPGETHPEDHVSLELEFMSVLSVKEAYALAEGWQEPLEIARHAQRRFVQDHLGTWTHTVTERLESCGPHPFYAALGEALRRLMRAEVTRLQVSPVTISGRLTDDEMGADALRCPLSSPHDRGGP